MEFNDFVYKLHVVKGGAAGPEFPASGNIRLVGVSYPKGPAPPGGFPYVTYFDGQGGGASGQPSALKDPDTVCKKNGCGLNMTQTLVRECDNDTTYPGFHLYCSQWKNYPWVHLLYASDYTSRRLFRRLLLHGFAVVMPQAWGGQVATHDRAAAPHPKGAESTVHYRRL